VARYVLDIPDMHKTRNLEQTRRETQKKICETKIIFLAHIKDRNKIKKHSAKLDYVSPERKVCQA
jgi:hypothetical protein